MNKNYARRLSLGLLMVLMISAPAAVWAQELGTEFSRLKDSVQKQVASIGLERSRCRIISDPASAKARAVAHYENKKSELAAAKRQLAKLVLVWNSLPLGFLLTESLKAQKKVVAQKQTELAAALGEAVELQGLIADGQGGVKSNLKIGVDLIESCTQLFY
ncbi:MAG: hypothetical protein A3J74_05795 [Elusimicrobia bacterium RIFCSPHIGHO2_02_FULL_57_9]|nr:MAG: hypothetical protein A3J74_05795 [Elusimicrobia bacterium RIFCSPHIGHO2_02_FULL_57_9]